MAEIKYGQFTDVDMRVGEIIGVNDFPEARKPSYRLRLNFGEEIGERDSCAQLVANYTPETLLGRLVVGVVNLPPMRMGSAKSEVLVLGAPDEDGNCVLLEPGEESVIGGKVY